MIYHCEICQEQIAKRPYLPPIPCAHCGVLGFGWGDHWGYWLRSTDLSYWWQQAATSHAMCAECLSFPCRVCRWYELIGWKKII